jgi:hypothetical protein
MRGVMGPPEMPTPGMVVYRETIRAWNDLRKIVGEEKLTDVDAAAIRKIAWRHKQCTDRLHRWGGESKQQFEHTRELYLSAFTTRVCATVRAFAKTRRRGTLEHIYQFAKNLDV